jgi:hypothetical protein
MIVGWPQSSLQVTAWANFLWHRAQRGYLFHSGEREVSPWISEHAAEPILTAGRVAACVVAQLSIPKKCFRFVARQKNAKLRQVNPGTR